MVASATNLLYIIPYFAPAWAYGGPPRVAFDMARNLVDRGYGVQVLTTDALDQSQRMRDRITNLDGIQVRRTPNLSNRLAWDYKIFLPLTFGAALRQTVRTINVVHLFDFRTYQNAVAVGMLRRRGVPFVVSAFGELPRATGVKRPIKMVYDLLYGYHLLRYASILLAQTDAEVTWYRRLGGRDEQIRIVPLAVDLGSISDLGPPGAFRRRCGISPDETMILFLGRIHEYKGIEMLIRSFAGAYASRPNIRLVIAGRDDGFQTQAEALAADLAPEAIIFPGPVYGRDRFRAYQDADLFAMTPSHAEQTSLAALEACACGTPILVTEQAPIPGLDEAVAGVTVPFDVGTIRTKLELLADNPVLRREMGTNASRLVKERFSWQRVTDLMENAYADARRMAPRPVVRS